MKRLKKDAEAPPGAAPSETVCRIRTNHIANLSRQFVEVMRKAQVAQLDIKATLKHKLVRKVKICLPAKHHRPHSPPDHPEISEDAINAQIEHPPAPQAQALVQDPTAIAYIMKRHDDIVSIAHAIDEISEMFVSAAVLVEMQGELITSIEQNCQQTRDYTKTVVENLGAAHRLRRRLLIVGAPG